MFFPNLLRYSCALFDQIALEPPDGCLEPPDGYMEPPEGYLEPLEGYMEPAEGAPDTATRNTTATTVITVRIRILIVNRLRKVVMETLSFECEGQAYLFVTKLLSKSLIKINWGSTCDVDTCQHQTEHEYGGMGEGGRWWQAGLRRCRRNRSKIILAADSSRRAHVEKHEGLAGSIASLLRILCV